MRHRIRKAKLGRTTEHRTRMLNHLVCSLIKHRKVKTTLAKAKAARVVADKMVTLGKKGQADGADVQYRRWHGGKGGGSTGTSRPLSVPLMRFTRKDSVTRVTLTISVRSIWSTGSSVISESLSVVWRDVFWNRSMPGRGAAEE